MTTQEQENKPILVPGMWPYGCAILGDGPSTPRLRAVSLVLAATEDISEKVVKFRAKYLRNGMLSADEVDRWIKEHLEPQRNQEQWFCGIPRSRLVAKKNGTYTIPKDVIAEAERHSPTDGDFPSIEKRLLFYATPECERVSEPIRLAGGALDELRTTARGLKEVHRDGFWSEWHAVTYILTSYAPLVSEDDFPLPERSGRRQTDKHLQLAAFCAQQDAILASPSQRLAEWNRRFPQWAYKNTTQFGWDSRQARRRIIPTDSDDLDEHETADETESTTEP